MTAAATDKRQTKQPSTHRAALVVATLHVSIPNSNVSIPNGSKQQQEINHKPNKTSQRTAL
jgi:hypothetical protein